MIFCIFGETTVYPVPSSDDDDSPPSTKRLILPLRPCLMEMSDSLMDVVRLAQASTSGNVGVINLLLKKGADVSVTDKDGVTTLMSAASHGHAQVRTCCAL